MERRKPGRPPYDWRYLEEVADLVVRKAFKKTPACTEVALKYFEDAYVESHRRRLLRKYNKSEKALLASARERLREGRQDRTRVVRRPTGIFADLENLASASSISTAYSYMSAVAQLESIMKSLGLPQHNMSAHLQDNLVLEIARRQQELMEPCRSILDQPWMQEITRTQDILRSALGSRFF